MSCSILRKGFMQGQSSCIKSPYVPYLGGALYMGRFYAGSKFLRKVSPCTIYLVPFTWEGFTQGQSSCVKSFHVPYRWCSLHGKVLCKVKVLA